MENVTLVPISSSYLQSEDAGGVKNSSQSGSMFGIEKKEENLNSVKSSPLEPGEAEEIVVELSKMVQNLQRDLVFSLDSKNGSTILRVVDRETEDIIREIPSEDIRRIRERMKEFSGILFKETT